MGFLETGKDVQDMIGTAETVMHYFGIAGQMPILDKFFGKSPYSPLKLPTFANAAGYCFQRLMERIQSASNGGEAEKSQRDFLDGFLEAKEQVPDVVDDNQVIGYLMLNILAGADTTAIVQKALIYHTLRNPTIAAKLRAELDAAGLAYPAAWDAVKDLPYLTAVIKESMRIHPAVGTILERIVPASGLTLPDGRVIAPGTIVGMNPWVLSRDRDVYGDDVETFRPERWLQDESAGESPEMFQARLKRMTDADFTWGGGNRICLGRHMATLELYKVTASLFGKYDVSL